MGRFINPFTDVGFQNVVFRRLAEVAEVSALSKEERIKYDSALKRYRDTLNAITGAEQKGRTEGRAEGVRVKALETARRMKDKGFSVEDIAEITDLSTGEIAAL